VRKGAGERGHSCARRGKRGRIAVTIKTTISVYSNRLRDITAYVILLRGDLAGQERELVLLLLPCVLVEGVESLGKDLVIVVILERGGVGVVHELLHDGVLILVVGSGVAEAELCHVVVDRDLPVVM
jgi:hypothetical protein